MGKPYLGFSSEERTLSSKLFRKKIALGLIEPPQKSKCEACFTKSGQIEWHREDYSIIEPWTIVTLCVRCHRSVHMRWRYPEGWDLYAMHVAEGWRWPATKSIGVIADLMASFSTKGARKVNPERPSTPLDVIESGKLMTGTPEDRAARMEALKVEYEALKGKRSVPGQDSLF